jgi:hypothetical protein
MKYFLKNILKRLEGYGKKLDQQSLVGNFNWVNVTDMTNQKQVYFFRPDGKLIIANNGIISSNGSWEFMGQGNLLITYSNVSYLLKHSFVDEQVLVLRRDGTEERALFVNESIYGKEINNVEDFISFMMERYGKRIREDYQSKLFQEFKGLYPDKNLGEIYLLIQEQMKVDNWD